MDISSFINSPGLWIASSLMVIVVVAQSVIFLCNAKKHASEVGLTDLQVKSGIRSSIITSIGPSFAPVLVLVSLIPVLGGATTWMRLCDVGAGRTELGMATVAVGSLGEELAAGSVSIKGFGAALWGMALNNFGWLFLTLILTHNMSKTMTVMNTKFNPKWIKLLTTAATLGLFGYLTVNSFAKKASPYLIAMLASGISILLFNKFFGNKKGIREWAMGICMVIGMVAGAIAA